MNWIGGARSRAQQDQLVPNSNFRRTNPNSNNGGQVQFRESSTGKRNCPLIDFVRTGMPNGNLLALQLSHQLEIDKDFDMVTRAPPVEDDNDEDVEMESREDDEQNGEGQGQEGHEQVDEDVYLSSDTSGDYSPLASTYVSEDEENDLDIIASPQSIYFTPKSHRSQYSRGTSPDIFPPVGNPQSLSTTPESGLSRNVVVQTPSTPSSSLASSPGNPPEGQLSRKSGLQSTTPYSTSTSGKESPATVPRNPLSLSTPPSQVSRNPMATSPSTSGNESPVSRNILSVSTAESQTSKDKNSGIPSSSTSGKETPIQTGPRTKRPYTPTPESQISRIRMMDVEDND